MGDPCTEEVQAHVDAQYADVLKQIETERQIAIEKYREHGYSVEIPPFQDPLAEGAPDIMADLDSPPEA
jgi:hypothetical protein